MAKKADEKTATPAEPSKQGYSAKEKDAILESVATGLSEGVPLRELCRKDGMPSFVAVYDWINASEEWTLRIARARESGADALAEECLSIADNASNDWMDNHNPDDPGYRLNGDHIQRSKLRIETRLKLLAKWSPKKYGDRTALEVAGDGGGPLVVQVVNYGGAIASPNPE